MSDRRPRFDPADDVLRSVARVAIGAASGANNPTLDITALIAKTWPNDRLANSGLLTRAPVGPMLSVPGGPLATIAYHFVASLQGVSAAAALISQSLALSFDNAAAISVPSLTLPKGSFVQQGAPIRVVAGTSSAGLVMQPYTIAVSVTLTNEMLRHSNGEQIVEQVLRENVGPTIDSLMLNANAAVADVSPAGILHGISPLTPSAAGANKFDDMVADLEALAEAVANVSAGQIAFVAAVPQALGIELRAENLDYPVLQSSALPTGTIVCIALPSLVTAIDPPMVDASPHTAIQHSDPAAQLVAADGTVGGPIMSMWQTDSTNIRLRMPASWGLRSPQGVAFMTGVNW